MDLLPFSEALALCDYWHTNPPGNELLTILVRATTTWKPPLSDDESSSPDEIAEAVAFAGGEVQAIDALPPHLRVCLDAAKHALATGKVN